MVLLFFTPLSRYTVNNCSTPSLALPSGDPSLWMNVNTVALVGVRTERKERERILLKIG